MKTLFPGWLIVMMLLASTRLTGQDIEKLLPSNDEVIGWKMTTEPNIYEGDKLFELIDGGAEIYLEYGFKRAVSVHYSDPSLNNILVEIYEMVDDASAYGIFSLSQQTVDWSKEFGNLSSVKEDYISFWKSRYYVNLSWSSRKSPDKPPLSMFAIIISQNIPEDGDYPEIVKSFEATEIGMKAAFLKGNLALSNFYYFDYKDIFSLPEAVASTHVFYHRIIIKYPDQDRAIEVLSEAMQSFMINKRFTDLTMTYQGFSCRDNKGNMILVRQIDNYIAILVALDKNFSLAPIMDEISLRIENNTMPEK
jgi:hypothetical protein